MMWHRQLSLAVGDVVDVIHPHPSIRGGGVVAMWQMWGLSKDSDVVMVGNGDMVWSVGISVGDKHALA